MSRAVLVLALAAMAGCASQARRPGADDPPQIARSVNLSGFSPKYKQGYTAGCEAASGRGAPRPRGSGADAQGWQDGFDYCKPRRTR